MEATENLARALQFQHWLLAISWWETGGEIARCRAGGSLLLAGGQRVNTFACFCTVVLMGL